MASLFPDALPDETPPSIKATFKVSRTLRFSENRKPYLPKAIGEKLLLLFFFCAVIREPCKISIQGLLIMMAMFKLLQRDH